MTIAGTTVTKASFTVDMTSVKSDRSAPRRSVPGPDHGHRRLPDRDVRAHEPDQSRAGTEGHEIKNYSATGNLTLHGTTKSVTIPLTAKRTDNVIAGAGHPPDHVLRLPRRQPERWSGERRQRRPDGVPAAAAALITACGARPRRGAEQLALAAFACSDAARSNSARASSKRPSFTSRSPRTLGSRW